jgi:protein-S-isoprenylcysteine O-methyltransferase Ste14
MKKIFIPPVLAVDAVLLIVAFYFFLPSYNMVPFPFNLGGLAIGFTGFIIMGKTRDLFRKYKTTLAIAEPSSIITEGVFSWTRNPMYLGFFLLLFGIAICFRNLFSILVAFGYLAIIHFVFVPKEEKLMTRQFGAQYLEYKGKVRRYF